MQERIIGKAWEGLLLVALMPPFSLRVVWTNRPLVELEPEPGQNPALC